MAHQLRNKVALITGGSSGIGAATAKLFAENAAKVIICGRNADNLNSVAKRCNSQVDTLVCDLSNESQVERLASEAAKIHGRLDVLVNNAGIIERGTIESTSLKQYDRVMNVNVRSLYQLTMLCLPMLKETKGSVVNVSSVNGMRSFPGVLAYNISKAAVDQFTRCVALEVAEYGVRVNSVNPGVTVTELHKRGYNWEDQAYDEFLKHSKTTHALGRPGQADEVARAIAFLASADASFTTGISLPVDGGRHAMCPR